MIDFRDIEVKAGNHSLIITVIIGLLSLLLLLISFSFEDSENQAQPIEIAMNFGHTDVGQGEAEPLPAEQTVATSSNSQTVENIREATKPTSPSRKVQTQNTTEDRTVAQPQKNSSTNNQPTQPSKPQPKQPKGDSRANNALSNILGGKGNANTSGQGNQGVAGNVGDPKGDQSHGTGIGENWKSTIPEPQTHQCSASGIIKVEIIVNAQGGIKSLTPGVRGSTSADACLKARAKELVTKYVRAYPGADGRKGIYEVNLR